MADIVTQNATLGVKLTMQRDEYGTVNTKTRSFSVRNPLIDEQGISFREKLQALQNFLLGDGNTLIQPTGWRDEDYEEDVWTTVGVEFTTEYGTTTKWDTRLTRGAAFYQTASSSAPITSISSVAESTTNPTIIYVKATGITQDTIFNVTSTGIPIFNYSHVQDDYIVIELCGVGEIGAGTVVVEFPAEGIYQESIIELEITK